MVSLTDNIGRNEIPTSLNDDLDAIGEGKENKGSTDRCVTQYDAGLSETS